MLEVGSRGEGGARIPAVKCPAESGVKVAVGRQGTYVPIVQ